MRRFELELPSTLSECIAALSSGNDDVKVVAGGTDLLPQMKNGVVKAARVVDLSGIPELQTLEIDTRRVVASRSPKPPHERLTITRPVIENARSIVMLATGVEKAPMVARALGGSLDVKAVPAQLARQATWIVDQAAAGQVLNP